MLLCFLCAYWRVRNSVHSPNPQFWVTILGFWVSVRKGIRLIKILLQHQNGSLHGTGAWPAVMEDVQRLEGAEGSVVIWMCGVSLKNGCGSEDLLRCLGFESVASGVDLWKEDQVRRGGGQVWRGQTRGDFCGKSEAGCGLVWTDQGDGSSS